MWRAALLIALAAAARAADVGEGACPAGVGACTRGDVLLQTAQVKTASKAVVGLGEDEEEQHAATGSDKPDEPKGPPPKHDGPDVGIYPPAKETGQTAVGLAQQHSQQEAKSSMRPPLPPPLPRASSYRGPVRAAPGALPSAEKVAALVQEQGLLGQSPMDWEVQHYRLLKQLRAAGFTCPTGQYYEPHPTPNLFAFDCRLWRAARAHSQDMGTQNYFDHYSLDGRDPCDRSNAQGLMACSENIAAGQDSPASALEALKASTHHCPNMMNPKHNRVGVGYFNAPSSTYKHYWTETMGDDDGPVDVACNPPDQGTYPQPAPKPSCRDKDEKGCAPFAAYAGSSTCNGDWTTKNCQKTCGFCGSPAPSPAPVGCQDKDPANCAPFAAYAGSSSCDGEWTKKNCQKTCGFCGATPGPAPRPSPPAGGGGGGGSDCKDKDPANCAPFKNYVGSSYCAGDWTTQNCQKTCGFCGSPAPGPPAGGGGGGGACNDKDPANCAPFNGYAGSSYCAGDWTTKNCQKTCGFCT